MGSRLSSVRQEPTNLTPHNSESEASLTRIVQPQVPSLSHTTQPTERILNRNPGRRTSASTSVSAGPGIERNTQQDNNYVLAINRLISEFEGSGITADDAHLLRLVRSYHSSSGSGSELDPRRTLRSQSIVDNWLSHEASLMHHQGSQQSLHAHRHRHGTSIPSASSRGRRGRHRGRASSSVTEDENDPLDLQNALRLSAAGRQALMSLAAASSRSHQWRDGLLLLDGADRRCIFCKRVVPHDEYDLHYVMCLTRSRVTYNEDKLMTDKGECAICLEDLKAGDSIARLPCLCIYHKSCIDVWFQRKQTCPEHPGD